MVIDRQRDDAAGWDKQVDVLAVGSGAGGLLAALASSIGGLDALVIEKSSEYGGTSATSGGGIWIPNSHHAAAAGQPDSTEEAFNYIRQLSAPNVPDENIRAFVTFAPEMLRWLEQHTPVRYMALPYPDYHAELPGGKVGYRTHLPMPLDGRLLGKDVNSLRPASPAASLFSRINWNFSETYALLFRSPGWLKMLTRMLSRYYLDLPHRLFSSKDRYLTLGNALVGALRLALNQRSVPVWLNTPMIELIRSDGRILGVVAQRDGRKFRIGARRGVVLAAGGFERNAQMRRKYMPHLANPLRSGGQINNCGESILAGMSVGAATMNMDSTWSAPVFCVPGEDRGRLSTVERALPGVIMVNQAGHRYMNEAASYHIAGLKMIEADRSGAGTSPSWMIFDARFRWKYPLGPLLPMVPDWLHSAAVRSVLKKSATISGLAQQIGMPAEALTSTITEFNEGAREGKDPKFGRGEAAYDRMYGDQRIQPNPSLAPIEKPPFYAFPIYPGDIGTNGGLATDARARVVDDTGHPIEGLYAVGNNAASVMGKSYPGAGSTLGPALTFAYVAARDLLRDF